MTQVARGKRRALPPVPTNVPVPVSSFPLSISVCLAAFPFQSPSILPSPCGVAICCSV
ncbi:hypothetical protein BCR39DRAFT_509763 [Naematelia encephala]|uniref:Uncharacterized protein n=1 Tax=Naematelia encephala TaxID=71784 RepID=A0A1Y2BKZ9_9TREE|nr:hypothetical protein BCR39DRAFT_509763 [Naematelia encephala]